LDSAPLNLRGFLIWKSLLNRSEQEQLRDTIRDAARQTPFVQPVTPSGKAMSVRMTSMGRFGWITDRKGYRYEAQHPNGNAWPPIPDQVLELWRKTTQLDRQPDACLVNYYGEGARMGMHQDKDEADFSWPVLSISLGDDALFRMGNIERGGKTESHWLQSGDVIVMGGDARLRHHGIDRLRFASSSLLSNGGRINLTLRVVT
jgi:alkylated DNA repair protein (DNA oxidative demethylase)